MLLKTLISPLISSTFHHKSLHFRLFSSTERIKVLRKVYSPLMVHKEGSQEWTKLIKSGKVWENYFHPFEWRAQDYDFQAKHIDFLKAIDDLKVSSKISSVDILRKLTVSFTEQSCAIEGNTLGLEETQKVWNLLKNRFNLDDFLKNQKMPLPAPSFLSVKPENEVIEIRNHLLATYFLYNTLYELEREIDFEDIKKIHRILLKDTRIERTELKEGYKHVGEFRKLEVGAYGFVNTVYPFSMEVPALMERFIQFRDESKNSGLHPLIIASRILSTFLHVHPFIDGNGRVGRSIMALYLIRHGYPPVVYRSFTRNEYISTIFLAQAEKDSIPLYSLVTKTIFDILTSYQV
ncbi:hypothetical protein Glove_334g33 [Diversispora epigaea]|uniref:Fido domain-containing protein n=1 Tax=Diversispora epigaea TaxID=1348612 RepID=A0A397HMN2_9GLOM|nr:hypothetical protein Glove_334g33 [Diversispora epigaea]